MRTDRKLLARPPTRQRWFLPSVISPLSHLAPGINRITPRKLHLPTTLKMATIHSLAPETLDHIFDLIARSPGDRETKGNWAATLLSASLVCTNWRDPAQRALFRNPTIRGGTPRSWVESEGRSRPGFGVRDAVVLWKPALTMDLHRLTELFATFGGVKTLYISIPNARIHNFAILELLTAPTLSGLQSLRLFADMESYVRPESPVFPFRLRHLELSSYPLPGSEFLRDLFEWSSQSLTSLVFDCDLFQHHHALLSNFPIVAGRLRHLGITLRHSRPSAVVFSTGIFFGRSGRPSNTLGPLSVGVQAPAYTPRIRLPLGLCTSLATLTVKFDYYPNSTQAKDSFLALAAALPLQATLGSLVISVVVSEGTNRVANAIAYPLVGALSSIIVHPAFANLNRIDFPGDGLSYLRVTKSGKAFLVQCQERGITVHGEQELLSLMEA